MGPAEPQIGAVAIVNQSSEAKPPKIPAVFLRDLKQQIWATYGKMMENMEV
jgi:hypothetical protein